MEEKQQPIGNTAEQLLLRSGALAVEVIVSLMQDQGVKPELRLKAAESVLDRICGKNAVPGNDGGDAAVRFEGVLEEWSR